MRNLTLIVSATAIILLAEANTGWRFDPFSFFAGAFAAAFARVPA